MSEPFLGETRWISWNYPPKGWAFCNGQLLPINQNQALFSLLGITYGGNGQTNFALPDLRGRAPVHVGSGFNQGQRAGEEAHTLSGPEMPQHLHGVTASGGSGTGAAPAQSYLANRQSNIYVPPGNPQSMNQGAVSQVGGSQPHQNMAPYIVLNCIIALQGIFPSRN
jgi:microcystin-dependent protein